mmetsp:Transcript_55553/g.119915  ORF Transcript_55553/g.119915 Transcript_55553/m.119915 type:complete len:203 (+) Transcript_55553:498-1106(+)
MASAHTIMGKSCATWAAGAVVSRRASESRFGEELPSTRESSAPGRSRAMGCFVGLTARCTAARGRPTTSTVWAHIESATSFSLPADGAMRGSMEWDATCGRTVVSIRASTMLILRTALASSSGLMVPGTRDFGRPAGSTDMVSLLLPAALLSAILGGTEDVGTHRCQFQWVPINSPVQPRVRFKPFPLHNNYRVEGFPHSCH